MADLDAMAHFALDHRIAAQLQTARRRAGAHLLQRASPSAHWINWAPVGLALVLVVITSWSLLADNAQSLDADLLADALPFDAYLDADFEAAVREDTVQLLEN